MPKQVEDMVLEADKLQDALVDNSDDRDDNFGYLDFDDDTNTDSTATIENAAPQDDFKHKYDVLRGKYDAEGSRMTEMLSTAMAENERLKLALGVPQKSADDHFSGDIDEITTLQKEYPSLAKGIEALTKKVVSESVKDTQLAVSQSRRESYVSKLDTDIADWRTINDDPEFMKWLQAKDKYTGASKHQLLKGAWDNFNLDATKAFFEDYKTEKGTTTAPRKSEDTFDLAPDTSGGTMPSKTTKGFVGQDEISTFYRDRAMGKFAGSEEDAAKIEAKIMRAVREGKVR